MKTLKAILTLILLGQGLPAFADGLIDLDGRWEYPHYLTWRPGNGQVCDVNPPRLSWPHEPQVIPESSNIPGREFCLQLSRDGDFADPEIEIRTPYNFYNALGVLEDAKWYWRVGYDVGTEREVWGVVRTFTFSDDAVMWDRRVITNAARLLASQKHPRLAPPGGDWKGWRQSLESNESTRGWLKGTLTQAQKVTRRPWWREFPASDVKGKTEYDDQQFARMGSEIALTSFAYRLTGDKQYERAKDHALALARFPKGGLSSPEYHGAPRKWPTRITEYLGLCYDWWYAELTAAERKTLLNSIEWRLHATFLEKASWRMGERVARQGSSVFCQSHPYEGFMWSMPGALLTAGDLDVADELVPLCLNYLTGVTSAHGPDEGWNEGVGYGGWKGQSMLGASLYVAHLLPELKLGPNPYYVRLGEWYSHLMPLGIQRLSFGDYSATPQRHWGTQRANAKMLAWLTGDGRFAYREDSIVSKIGDGSGGRAWLDLLSATQFQRRQAVRGSRTSAVFPEAGWVMVSTGDHSDWDAFDESVGMIFQCRPRGGFSHSYRAENDFVWHAYGQTLSAGGGGTAYPDPHSRHSLSHNVMLINGQGQEWEPRTPGYPFVGRLLAYEEKDGYTYWVGDATHAYQSIEGLLRWHRYVVFVDGKWFAIYDDVAMRPQAKPAKSSWLFHVAPDVPLKLSAKTAGFSYRMEDVNAKVAIAKKQSDVEVVNLRKRDGFRNLITGGDMYEQTVEKVASKGRDLTDEQIMSHNIWVTNTRPAREWSLLTVLAAWREGEAEPEIAFDRENVVSISCGRNKTRRLSFNPAVQGDITIDVGRIRRHALETEPEVLPPEGKREAVKLAGDKYEVDWLATEDFNGPDWMSRWFVEGNSEVQVRDGRLCIRNLHEGKANVATAWFRPELPKNVIVRFKAKAIEPAEKNAANLNLFLHARENDGDPVRFGRGGQYKEYHTIPNYIVTFVGGYRPGWSRARRDPGFNLLHEAEVRSEIGREYDIAVTLHEGRLRYYIDGKLIHDVVDPKPLDGGRFAIRTWSTNAWWDDVKFGRIVEAVGNR